MSRKPDPRLFPPTPPKGWLDFYRLPEFRRLGALLEHFMGLLLREKMEPGHLAKVKPNIDLGLLLELWLSTGLNDAAVDLDTAAFSSATVIREQYQPPVLAKTSESLKPAAVSLMGEIDRWMADGIGWLFDSNQDANQMLVWTMRGRSLMTELTKIWSASGGGLASDPDAQMPNNTDPITPQGQSELSKNEPALDIPDQKITDENSQQEAHKHIRRNMASPNQHEGVKAKTALFFLAVIEGVATLFFWVFADYCGIHHRLHLMDFSFYLTFVTLIAVAAFMAHRYWPHFWTICFAYIISCALMGWLVYSWAEPSPSQVAQPPQVQLPQPVSQPVIDFAIRATTIISVPTPNSTPQIWNVYGPLGNEVRQPVFFLMFIQFVNRRDKACMVDSYSIETRCSSGNWETMPDFAKIGQQLFFVTDFHNADAVAIAGERFEDARMNRTLIPGDTVQGWIALSAPKDGFTFNFRMRVVDTAGDETVETLRTPKPPENTTQPSPGIERMVFQILKRGVDISEFPIQIYREPAH